MSIFAQRGSLAEFVTLTKDGEWGKAEPFHDSVAMRIIRGTDFDRVRRGDWSDVPTRHVSRKHAELKSLRDTDLIIETAGGSLDRPTGRTLYLKRGTVSSQDVPITCASFARFIRLDTELVEPEYVYWWLQYLYETRRLLAFQTQHTGIARFQWTTCSRSIIVPAISRSSQRKIAAVLSAYNDVIENNSRRIMLLEEMAQRIYHEWFVDFRYPGYESVPLVGSELGPIPERWEVTPFAALGEYVNGFAFKPQDWGEQGQPIVKIRELKNGVTDGTPRYAGDIGEKYFVRDGDLLFSWSADLDAYLWTGGPAWLNQHLFRVDPSPGIPSAFLFHALRERMAEFRSKAQGTTMRHIKRAALDQVTTVVPPLSLRKELAEIVAPVDSLSLELVRATRTLRVTRDLLLLRLVGGEIDVTGLKIATPELAA